MRKIILSCFLFILSFSLFSQSQNLQGSYASTGFFFHPTASRLMNATKTVTQISANRYQLFLADLGGNGFEFTFEIDASNNLVNWSAAGATPASPQSGFMTADNLGGFAFYPGGTTGYVHNTYNNRYDPITKTFWLHYGYQFGTTTESQYQRQVYEKLQWIVPQDITSISDTAGTYGKQITITGSGFAGRVPYFRSAPTLVDSFHVDSDTQIRFWVGSAIQSGQYRLYVGSDSADNNFYYTRPTLTDTLWHGMGSRSSSISFGRMLEVSSAISESGVTYITAIDSLSNIVFAEYDKGNWITLSSDINISGAKASSISTTTTPDGMPVIAYVDSSSSNQIVVKKRNNGIWSTIGTGGIGTHALPGKIQMVCDGIGDIYVLTSAQNQGYSATVYKYSNNSWISLGEATNGAGNYITMDIDGTTHIVYVTYVAVSTGQASVRKYQSGVWSNVGNTNFSTGAFGAYYPTIKVDRNGSPVVVLQEDDGFERLSMFKLQSGVWNKTGSDRFSRGRSYNPSLAFDVNNLPVISFQDGGYANLFSVIKQQSNGTWEFVGNRCGINSRNQQVKIQLDSNNRPVMIFVDQTIGWIDCRKLRSTTQRSDLSGSYQADGYFFHPTASRLMNQTKTISR
ncbi:MAG: hypothetical protein RL582_43, partial [Bacteroidota bacterium]